MRPERLGSIHHNPAQSPNQAQPDSHPDSVGSDLAKAQFEVSRLALMNLQLQPAATVNTVEIQSSRPDTRYWQSEFYPVQHMVLTDAPDLQESFHPLPESGQTAILPETFRSTLHSLCLHR